MKALAPSGASVLVPAQWDEPRYRNNGNAGKVF